MHCTSTVGHHPHFPSCPPIFLPFPPPPLPLLFSPPLLSPSPLPFPFARPTDGLRCRCTVQCCTFVRPPALVLRFSNIIFISSPWKYGKTYTCTRFSTFFFIKDTSWSCGSYPSLFWNKNSFKFAVTFDFEGQSAYYQTT